MSKSKKQAKPVAPKLSMFYYEPYIERLKREIDSMDKFLEDIREQRVSIDLRLWQANNGEDVYNLIVDRRNVRAKIVNYWQHWVEMSAPVLVPDEKERPIEDVSNPESYWYEADLLDLTESKYVKQLTVPSGKWKNILKLRGHLLVGDALQIKILRNLYIAVMGEYTYSHGFKSIEKEFYIMPHDDWRDKMGAIVFTNGAMRVIINK